MSIYRSNAVFSGRRVQTDREACTTTRFCIVLRTDVIHPWWNSRCDVDKSDLAVGHRLLYSTRQRFQYRIALVGFHWEPNFCTGLYFILLRYDMIYTSRALPVARASCDARNVSCVR